MDMAIEEVKSGEEIVRSGLPLEWLRQNHIGGLDKQNNMGSNRLVCLPCDIFSVEHFAESLPRVRPAKSQRAFAATREEVSENAVTTADIDRKISGDKPVQK